MRCCDTVRFGQPKTSKAFLPNYKKSMSIMVSLLVQNIVAFGEEYIATNLRTVEKVLEMRGVSLQTSHRV